MNKKSNHITIAIIVGTLLILVLYSSINHKSQLNSSKSQVDLDSGSRLVMGTFTRVVAVTADSATAERCIAAAIAEVENVDKLMSDYKSDSEISELNRDGFKRAVKLSKSTFEVLKKSITFSKLSDGAFDVTIGPLVDLWHRAGDTNSVPSDEQLAAAAAKVGYEKLILEPNQTSARFATEGMRVDLGAIAKGYAVDKAVEAMQRDGALGGMVVIGGEIRCFGRPPQGKSKWLIGLQDPSEIKEGGIGGGRLLLTLELSDGAVSTSGDYQRFVSVGGKHYSHIIDRKNRTSAQGLSSVTIIAENATDADALATAVSVMGRQRGLELIKSLDKTEAILIPAGPEQQLVCTKGSRQYISQIISENLKDTRNNKINQTVMVLVEDGKPNATIIIKKDATALQKEPAEDLQKCIQKISGAILPIADDTNALKGNLILIGESTFTKNIGIDTSKLTGDSFIIRTVGNRLILAGRDDELQVDTGGCGITKKRGTENAVNVFLQDYCGVRWFMPGQLGQVTPAKKTISIPEINRQEQFYRLYAAGAFYGQPEWGQWSVRNFFGSSVFFYHTGGHLWHILIPAKEYFEKHPEWFALLKGKREEKGIGQGNHLCTSNKEMWMEALKNLENMYVQGYEMIDLGQTDGYQRCRCQECEAMDAYRDDGGYYVPGRPADRIWVFHDFLAREIRKAYPDRKIMIISYCPTGDVPGCIEKLPDNVIVEWCHQGPEVIQRWTKFHDQFTVYLYWFTSETRDFLPLSLFDVDQEFKRLTAAGAKGYFFCFAGACWGTNGPTYYLLGQLVRDPNRNADQVLSEFCGGLFEQAAVPMENYFRTLYQGVSRAKRLHWKPEVIGKAYNMPQEIILADIYTTCFTDDILESCQKNLNQAEGLANNDAVRKRIRFFRDGFDYLKLTTYGFARFKDYQKDRSDENLQELKDAVEQRNQFAREMDTRQKIDYQKGLLPLVARGAENTVEDLLYGGPRQLFMDPFGKIIKGDNMHKKYKVMRADRPVKLGGDWFGQDWGNIGAIDINNYMGDKPEHKPKTQAKVLYDDKFIYVIFRVEDKYVRAVAQNYQDKAYQDSCVEFFFAPGKDISLGYFNIEMNCGGTMLFHYQSAPRTNVAAVSNSDCNKIEVFHSEPKIVEPEKQQPTVWLVEYRVPIDILKKYCPSLTIPAPGVLWRANFYKCADNTSHPHWLTWSVVDNPQPNFHLPQFFGSLEFK